MSLSAFRCRRKDTTVMSCAPTVATFQGANRSIQCLNREGFSGCQSLAFSASSTARTTGTQATQRDIEGTQDIPEPEVLLPYWNTTESVDWFTRQPSA